MSTTTTSRLPDSEAAQQASTTRKESKEAAQNSPLNWDWLETSPSKLAAALFFGTIFGFLLQRGGVAKFDILVGALLLENFIVVKVMLSAIIVGMLGSYFLRRMGLIELKISETKYAANSIGGLIFGIGFGLLAYCPGTNAAAVGQGNLDAVTGIVGLLLGSYIFALSSKYTSGTISSWGQRGKLTLPELVGCSSGMFVAVAAAVLGVVLIIIEYAGY